MTLFTEKNIVRVYRENDKFFIQYDGIVEIKVNIAAPVYTGNLNAKGKQNVSRTLKSIREARRNVRKEVTVPVNGKAAQFILKRLKSQDRIINYFYKDNGWEFQMKQGE